jgi:hypothetical protein
MSLPRSSQSPGEPRNKRLRRLSSTEEEMELSAGASGPGRGVDKSGADVAYYGQSPASLSSQTSWHSDVDHGRFLFLLNDQLHCVNYFCVTNPGVRVRELGSETRKKRHYWLFSLSPHFLCACFHSLSSCPHPPTAYISVCFSLLPMRIYIPYCTKINHPPFHPPLLYCIKHTMY